MKPLLLVVAVALVASLVACGGDTGPAGTYVLVKDQTLKDAMTRKGTADLSKDMVEMMTKMFDEMSMELTLKSDGTFSVEGSMGEKFTASGSWTLKGKDLTITSSVENGKKREKPETTALVYENGEIRMPKEKNAAPVDLVLRKK